MRTLNTRMLIAIIKLPHDLHPARISFKNIQEFHLTSRTVVLWLCHGYVRVMPRLERVMQKNVHKITTVRDDYRDFTAWTYAEASDFSGLGVRRIRELLSSGEIKRGHLVGPFNVDAESFKAWLREG